MSASPFRAGLRVRRCMSFVTIFGIGASLLALGLVGCAPSGPRSDSQTHWLQPCDGPEDCGRLECLCGYCAAICETDGACREDRTQARCFESSSASAISLCGEDEPPQGICLDACSEGETCAEGERCVDGACIPERAVSQFPEALGQPVGPLQRDFMVPEQARIAAPDGSGASCTLESPCDLAEAVGGARSGDTVALLGGRYRTGALTFNQDIAIQAYGGDRPILSGSVVVDTWTPAGALWTASLEEVPATTDEGEPHAGLWIDGVAARPVATAEEVGAGSFHIDFVAGTVTIGDNPADKTIEVVRYAFGLERVSWNLSGSNSPDEAGLRVRGLTFEHYATMALWGRAAGITIEHCTFQDGAHDGVMLYQNNNTIRFNEFTNNRAAALVQPNGADSVFAFNWVHGNSWEGGTGSPNYGVVRLGRWTGTVASHNLLEHNGGHGLWGGARAQGATFLVGNVIRDCSSADVSGINVEGSIGVTIAGNVVSGCHYGISVSNSQDTRIVNNTLTDALLPLRVREYFRNDGIEGPGNSDGTRIFNNVLSGGDESTWPQALLLVSSGLCGEHTIIDLLDHNAYFRLSANVPLRVAAFNPSPDPGEQNAECSDQPIDYFESLAAFTAATGHEQHGLTGLTQELPDDPSRDAPSPESSIADGGQELPEDIRQLLRWPPLDSPQGALRP